MSDLKFIGWRVLELALYITGFPFLFVGAWVMHASDWCAMQAQKYK